MLISLDWLKQYIDIKEEINELENSLTMIGQEVEGKEIQGKDLNNIVIGKIIEFNKHAEAEKLTVLKVDIGNEEILQIVCGAPNHKLNDCVVVAKIGAILPGNFKIKKNKIRGIESCGMLCSEVELGLGTEGDGIIILPKTEEIGKEYREYLGLNDVVFKLEITPNRPDCLSHIGIAREISAYYKRKIKYPIISIKEVVEHIGNNLTVKLEDKLRCKDYVARYIKNVSVKESPDWLKKRILSMGLKPINNIVDISNFIMFEYNQPIHIFDADKIYNATLIIREAKKGEKIVTLDGVERELDGELVVADSQKPLAIAGILGDKDSGVDENTKNILIEVAYYTPENIRKTSKKLGISTEASYRFERGLDRGNLITVVDRASHLINEAAGGQILKGIINESVEKVAKVEIPLNIDKLNKFIGKEITFEEVGFILTNLNLEIKIINKKDILVIPPTYRKDLTRTEDLYEEVIRMHGFENIEDKMPIENIAPGKKDKVVELVDNVKNTLKNCGLQEVINYSFISQKAIEIMGIKEKTIEILNPINDDFKIMRPTLIYSLLSNIRDNFNRNQDSLKFYEVSKVFFPAESLAKEEYRIGIAISGKNSRGLWDIKPESYDFYSLKGYVEKLFEKLGINKYQINKSENQNFHPGRSGDIYIGKEYIGTFGEIHPNLSEKMEIKKDRVYIAEFNLALMEKYMKPKIKYEKIVKYPEVTRDLAIILDDSVLVGNMINEIKKVSPLVENVDIFDIYKSETIQSGKKSVAISFVLRNKLGTLEEKEIQEVTNKILNLLDKTYGGQIRQI
ncbi:MAG: phenylalanine--tRNA ligase subunit beta [Fusobacteriaceae bacterium]